MDNNFNTITDSTDAVSAQSVEANPDDASTASNQTTTVTSAFSDDSTHRLMNSSGQQIPQPYQTMPNQTQPTAPQYAQYPQQTQPVAPQYAQYQQQAQPVAPQYAQYQQQAQPVAPQYAQYQQQAQPVAPQYAQYQQPVAPQAQQVTYVMVPVKPLPQPCTREARKLYRKHCSRIGWAAMADIGLMFAVQILVSYLGVYIYSILRATNVVSEIDNVSLSTNITMFAMAVSALVGNLVPSSAHGRKWRVKFTDPFKGDKLKPGFVLTATITAIGVNFIWGIIYNIITYSPDATSSEGYTQYNTPPVALWLMVIWTCVIAPVTEEYMFRGIFMRMLSKYGTTFGIVTSALMFGLMHGNLAQTPMTFMIGLIMGYVAAKSGNIRQAIFIHAVNNTFVTLPQIILYYCPESEGLLNLLYLVLELAMMIFAIVALIRFAVIRSKGKKARALRLAQGQNVIYKEEARWMDIEIPEKHMRTEFVLVKHKFLHFATSFGMVFFILYCLLSILLSMITY